MINAISLSPSLGQDIHNIVPSSGIRYELARRQLEFDFGIEPEPFVKWAGGKRSLLSQLQTLLPHAREYERYFEPFAGGAAMFFHLRPRHAVLADINAQLLAVYRCVKLDVEALIERLRELAARHSDQMFYDVRARYNASVVPSLERCADFVYLNRTCFNGLHRVNRRGHFNVSCGRYRSPRIVNASNLRAVSRSLQSVELLSGSFQTTLSRARARDFVYLDPPYDVSPGETSFTQYAEPFGAAEQDALVDAYSALDARGCKLMMSNSDTAANRARYREYRIVEVRAPRLISRDGAKRGAVTELAILNY